MKEKYGDQFKDNEKACDRILNPQDPVVIRLDGKAFHTFTRGFEKPFSSILHEAMCHAAGVLCKEIQNVRFAYTQSDEISIILHKRRPESELWYGNRVQKMASVAASICTTAFNGSLADPGKPAHFDARVFTEWRIPEYFTWRQDDAIRNSVAMLAQAHFSPKQLHGKNRRDMHEMLAEKDIFWNDLEDWKQRGSIVTKQWREHHGPNGELCHRSFWAREQTCPNFRADNFIDRMLEQETSSI